MSQRSRLRAHPVMSQRIGLGAHIDMNHQGEALKAMGQRVRRWQIHLKVSFNLADLARWMNPIVRGWMQYYGRFYRTELHPLLKRINSYVMRWARAKYRRLHRFKKARAWWDAVCERYPRGFAHWAWTRGLMQAGW